MKYENRPSIKILFLLQFLQQILQISHKHSQPNIKGPLEAGFFDFHPRSPLKKSNFFKGQFFDEILTFGSSKKNLGGEFENPASRGPL